MAKRPEVKQAESEQPTETTAPVAAPEPERAVIGKKTVLTLNIAYNLRVDKTVKAGTRLYTNTADYYLVSQAHPDALKEVNRGVYDVTRDVVVKTKKKLPVGTVLDPVKDKELIDRIKAKHLPEDCVIKEIPTV